jgi:ligand-binding SRPBCC domain-containing protein
MAAYELVAECVLGRPVPEVFATFGEARNLEAMTPPWLRFQILEPLPVTMAPGTLIDYRLRLHGIPLRWRTAITAWEPPFRFVDEQVRGPYRSWVHEHTFEAHGGGTAARDRVRYEVPGGSAVNRFLVAPDLERIFGFRQRVLVERFGGRVGPVRIGRVASAGGGAAARP